VATMKFTQRLRGGVATGPLISRPMATASVPGDQYRPAPRRGLLGASVHSRADQVSRNQRHSDRARPWRADVQTSDAHRIASSRAPSLNTRISTCGRIGLAMAAATRIHCLFETIASRGKRSSSNSLERS